MKSTIEQAAEKEAASIKSPSSRRQAENYFIIGALSEAAKSHWQGKWIAVEESKPEEQTQVQIYCGYVSRGFWNGEDWYETYCGERNDTTHWRPLPEAPKSETK